MGWCYSTPLRSYASVLGQKFPNPFMERAGPISWPPRSLHLKSCGIFMSIFERYYIRSASQHNFGAKSLKLHGRLQYWKWYSGKCLQEHGKSFMHCVDRRWWSFRASSNLRILLWLRLTCPIEHRKRLKTFKIKALNFWLVLINTLYSEKVQLWQSWRPKAWKNKNLCNSTEAFSVSIPGFILIPSHIRFLSFQHLLETILCFYMVRTIT